MATVYDADQACVIHYVNRERATHEPLEEPASGLLKIGKATIGSWSAPTPRHRRSSVRNLNGRMDELIVFGQALDDREVCRIHEVGRPWRCEVSAAFVDKLKLLSKTEYQQ